ncbi:cytochrome P450 [Pseudofrankia asymbiotica]|uniref:Cytochrome n=1 Tax=Pseudofrankia asymbiotica TaxID=1834516 RepID=A0A1V2I7Q8_9ACTN|nr:cytochrome P450 [Pseudofrankia asymbiotica]ONH27989.1 hypothetical protein BL253_20490 [Pseudofrankia asymbiotica]
MTASTVEGGIEDGVDPLNPFAAPAFTRRPHPEYDRVRALDPLPHCAGVGWIALAYEDCRDLLKSDLTRQADPAEWQPDYGLPGIEELQQTIREWIGMSNEPEHKRRRALADRAFKRTSVHGLRQIIDSYVDQLIDGIQADGGGDLVADLAYQLPMYVICEMLGMPESDRDLLHDWTHDISVTYSPIVTREQIQAGITAAQQMQAHFRELIAARRADPREDLLTGFAFAEENGHTLTEHEIASNAVLVFLAGHQTTASAIGGGLLQLFSERNAAQLAAVRAGRPKILPAAVEEIMRYSGSVHAVWRVADADFSRRDKQIRRDDTIVVALGSANRDPGVFDAPHVFDVTRPVTAPHLGFGWGAHFCLGAHLGRLEIGTVVDRVLDRLPTLRLLTEDPEPGGQIHHHGPKSLPATL